jgi:hypothetical protein
VEFFKVKEEGGLTGSEFMSQTHPPIQSKPKNIKTSKPTPNVLSIAGDGGEKTSSMQKVVAVGAGSPGKNGHTKTENDFFEEF